MKKIIIFLVVFLVVAVAAIGVIAVVKNSQDEAPAKVTAHQKAPDSELSTVKNNSGSASGDVSRAPSETQGETTDYLATLSDDELEMLNIFLSNFSEVFVYDIDTSDVGRLIDFVYLNTKVNYLENIVYDGVTVENPETGEKFSGYLTEEYVHERVDRFFGVKFEPRSSEYCYYKDGKYYLSMADGETYSNFSKVTSARKDSYGMITVEYDVYYFDINFIDMPDRYKGVGTENLDMSDCTYQHSGRAVLKERYFSESHANYQLVSLERIN